MGAARLASGRTGTTSTPADALDGAEPPIGGDRGAAERRPRFQQYRLLAPTFILLVLWLWLFYAEGAFRGGPNGKTFGADFAMFVGAAKVMSTGGNPYDYSHLYRTERALLAGQHITLLAGRGVVRVGNPPLFFWLLRPLAGASFQAAALAWIALLYLMMAAGFLVLLRYLRWSRWVLPLALFLLAPPVVLGPFYGNVVPVVFAGLAISLYLVDDHPALAGAVMTVAWLKPPVALPFVFLILLFHAARWRSTARAFAAASLLLLALTAGITGVTSLGQWIHGLLGYSADTGSLPDIASLAGLYVRDVPYTARLAAEALGIVVASILTACAWVQLRREGSVPLAAVGWLWIVWFLATPYAHFYDEVILAFPIVAIMGRNGARVTRREPAWILSLALGSLLLISSAPHRIQLLWLPLLAMAFLAHAAARSGRYRRGIVAATA